MLREKARRHLPLYWTEYIETDTRIVEREKGNSIQLMS